MINNVHCPKGSLTENGLENKMSWSVTNENIENANNARGGRESGLVENFTIKSFTGPVQGNYGAQYTAIFDVDGVDIKKWYDEPNPNDADRFQKQIKALSKLAASFGITESFDADNICEVFEGATGGCGYLIVPPESQAPDGTKFYWEIYVLTPAEKERIVSGTWSGPTHYKYDRWQKENKGAAAGRSAAPSAPRTRRAPPAPRRPRRASSPAE